ncbi:cysteine desulfurase family protein [uncultured Anaerococcus sp.]|uniref:cysteine desulfurase family protein n=1 Tax=uncultured Anaerococcus sp. TaxID=293428 RepID=UPI00280B37A4|nr:cysteine desulfurase family protein [uncultured Anaerococcus sp.]MDU5148851.1 cysteine desulfurase family protein [Anaerococcus prevotii]
MKKIYFDYAATSIKRKEILEDIVKDADIFDGNPDSTHSYGRDAKKILEDARIKISKSIGSDPKNLIFTSGASESNNTVINHYKEAGIISTNIEHDSIMNTLEGKNVKYLRADKNGLVSLDDLKKLIDDETRLVMVMAVNNEIGTIEPIKEIGSYLKDKDIHFHVDAVQAYGHMDIDVGEINCDSLSLSGHKVGGINGFGILYLRNNLSPLILGGEQEKHRRAGTSFTMGAYSMAKAFEKTQEERSKIKELKEYFIDNLKNTGLNYQINGSLEKSSDHIINIYFADYKSDFLLTYLDMNGVCASAGSACRAGSFLPSHVISNMYDESRANHSIRFSFGYQNNKEEIDKVIEVLSNL